MELVGFQSLKGRAVDETEFTQTLVNLVYGLAIEVNKLQRELVEIRVGAEAVSEDSPTPES